MVDDDDKWYTQRGARLQGPFSRLTIHRYLLLGRIKSSDRVSKDGNLWEPITQVPQLIPEELLDLETDDGWQNFLQARDSVDERKLQDTDEQLISTQHFKREDEASVLSRLREEWKRSLSIEPRKQARASILPISLFGVTLAVVLILGIVSYILP